MAKPDCDKVAPRLYQGGAINPAAAHHYAPFTMIVLCAEEEQPTMRLFRSKVLRPAFRDTLTPTVDEMTRAWKASQEVATELERGGRVLVTCAKGLNRSGLVTGLALVHTTTMPSAAIVHFIQRARGPRALGNLTFRKIIEDARRRVA